MGKLAGRGLGSRLRRKPGRLVRVDKAGAPVRMRPVDVSRWYSSARWKRLREQVFLRDGFQCRATGVMLAGVHPAPDAPVCDHIVPHRGDAALFWDIDNLQAVSKAYHDQEKQRQERRGEGG